MTALRRACCLATVVAGLSGGVSTDARAAGPEPGSPSGGVRAETTVTAESHEAFRARDMLDRIEPTQILDVLRAMGGDGTQPESDESLAELAERPASPTLLIPGIAVNPALEDGFREAVLAAVKAHPRYGEQMARLRETRAIGQEVAAAWQPQLAAGVTGGLAFFEGNANDNRRSTAGDGVTSEADAFISGSQLLYDFGATESRIGAAGAATRAVIGELQELKATLIFDAVNAGTDILKARAQLSLADENLEFHRLIVGFARDRADAGIGTQGDVLRAEARLAGAEADRVEIEQAMLEATSRYVELFGDVPPADTAPGFPPMLALAPENPDAAIAQARSFGAQARVAKAEADRRRHEVSAEEAGFWPSLNLQVRATKFDVLEGTPDVEVTGRLVAQVDLYTGGAADARLRQARERLNQASRSADSTLRTLERDTRIAYDQYRSRTRQLRAIEQALRQNHRARLSILQQFRLRGAGLIEVLGTQDDYFGVARRYVDAFAAARMAVYRLSQVTGELPERFAVTQP